MTTKQDGGAAFPEGVALRDYFAGQFLAGFMANPNARAMMDASREGDQTIGQTTADLAYGYADAMLAAREASQ